MSEPDSGSASARLPDIQRDVRLVRVATLVCAAMTAVPLLVLAPQAWGPRGFLYWPAYLLPVLHLAVLWRLRSPPGRPGGARLAWVTGGLGAVAGLLLVASRATGHLSENLTAGLALFGPLFLVHVGLAVAAGRLGAALRGEDTRRVPRALVYAAAAVVILFAVWVALPTHVYPVAAANESAALGDVRNVISAQAAYASANGGYYDELRCLATPRECIPGYPPEAPSFLGEKATEKVREGYRRELRAGPAAAAEGEEAKRISPSSIRSFAYVAVPVEPGRSGHRAFCGRSDGVIVYSPDGAMPPSQDGRCPPGLEELW